MKTVHVVGNSHVMYYVGRNVPIDSEVIRAENDLEIHAFKAGSTGATIYSLDKKGSTTGAGTKIAEYVRTHDVQNLVISLGDVDFREHMLKHLPRGVGSVSEYLDDLMRRYENYILKELRPHVKGKIALQTMIPFAESYYRFKLGEDIRNGALWFLNQRFNDAILYLCAHNGWDYVGFGKLADSHGFLRPEFVMSPVEVHADPAKVFPFTYERLESLYGQG